MMRTLTLLAGLFWLAATGALAAVLPVAPATLAAIQASAKAGDTLQLGPGAGYGLVKITRSGLTFEADPAALLDGIWMVGVSDVSWQGGAAELPSAGAVSSTPAVRIVNSHRVAVRGVGIRGALAITGVTQAALATDPRPGDNVIGLPTGRGISVEFSDHVTLEGNDVSRVHKGIVLSRSPDVTIRRNTIHDFRTSGIAGDAPNNTLIEGNWIRNAFPFLYGDPSGKGDHGDPSHMWTPAGMGLTAPTTGLVYRDNLIEQGEGVSLCCAIFFEDNSGFGFTGALIERNTILNGSAQGIAVSHATATIRGNTLLQTSGDLKAAPTLLTNRPGSVPSVLVFEGNTLADVYGIAAKYPANTWLAPGRRPQAELDAARAAALKAIGLAPPDPRDATIAELKAQLAALAAQLAAANDNLAAANANAVRLGADRDTALARIAAAVSALAQ